MQTHVYREGLVVEQDRHWSAAQNQRLREVFRDSLPADLEKEFFRAYRAIAAQANKLGIYRPERYAEARRLLDGSLVSAYWLGFLLADGNFGRGYTQCDLDVKDKGHVQNWPRISATAAAFAEKTTAGV